MLRTSVLLLLLVGTLLIARAHSMASNSAAPSGLARLLAPAAVASMERKASGLTIEHVYVTAPY